jgi:uncharacterized membrane protein
MVMTAEWSVKDVVTIGIALGALVLALVTPAMANVVLWLLRSRAWSQFGNMVIDALEDKKNRARTKELVAELFAEEMRLTKEARDAVSSNSDRLDAVEASLTAHGVLLHRLEEKVQDVPSLAPAITRIGNVVEDIGRNFEAMGRSMARIDERQKLMWPILDARRRQEPNSPRRRSSDHRDSEFQRDDDDGDGDER